MPGLQKQVLVELGENLPLWRRSAWCISCIQIGGIPAVRAYGGTMASGIGFDNERYLREQTRCILDRVQRFDNKLYLEFGESSCTTTMPPGPARL
jgi:hypothetical protein